MPPALHADGIPAAIYLKGNGDMSSMTDSPSRAAFAARFGDDEAEALTRAATSHDNDVHDNRGSDPFKWVLSICIGYQCFEIDGYRKYHAITAPFEDVKAWIASNADLGSHDGDVDYFGMLAGAYDEYLSEAVQS